jgi:hypothetical protein
MNNVAYFHVLQPFQICRFWVRITGCMVGIAADILVMYYMCVILLVALATQNLYVVHDVRFFLFILNLLQCYRLCYL